MKTKITMTCVALATVVAAVGQERGADDWSDKGQKDNLWRAQVGWVHQWNRSMSVSDAESSLPITDVDGRRLLSNMPALAYPDNKAFIPRTFDNGYVRPDQWTGDRTLLEGSNPERFGTTWNWGASAGQYNYDGGRHPTLAFSIDRGEAVLGNSAADISTSGKQKDDVSTDGIELKLNRLLYAWMKDDGDSRTTVSNVIMKLDMVVRLAWFPTDEQKYHRSASQSVSAISESYTYNDFYGGSGAPGGPYPPLGVPYAGSYGSATSAGSLLPVTPESSRQYKTFMGSVQDSVEIKSEIWRLRGALGLEYAMTLTKKLNVFLAPQFVLELVQMDVDRTQSMTFTSGSSGPTTIVVSQADRETKTAVVPGFLLTAGADYRFTENWFVGAGFGWEWLTENPSVRAGRSRVRFDLDGGELNLFLGRQF